jgi:hypothetical protein
VVNFYDGGERDTVSISLDGGKKVSMEYVERTDPYYERLFEKYKASPDEYSSPVISSHIWQFLLPKLNPGIHSAKINAVDEFGFKDEEIFTFEILEK